jgi:predicted O-methyltransferase YrrM
LAIQFRATQRAIDLAVEKLKRDGVVHPEASFSPDAPGGLRREVAYYDRDFLYRLGRTSDEAGVVDAALDLLRESGLVEPSASYDRDACEKHRRDLKAGFHGTWTSLTPTMERLFYMLTSVRRPMHLLELGSFWGYTLAWFAGPCVGSHRVYRADRIIGVEIDAEMTARARENFAKLPNSDEVDLIAEDARTAIERLPGTFDFVYIEAKVDDGDTEGLYLTLLEQLYEQLPRGAWVMAHDNLDWSFSEEMRAYLAYVRDGSRFSESISFEIDSCGLELSIK